MTMTASADSVVRGNIRTMDPSRPLVEAFAVSQGIIVKTGSFEECRQAVSADCTIFDCAGKTILPGLIDSHNHMLASAMQHDLVDLSGCRSIQDILDEVSRYCRNHPEKPWVVGAQGWQLDSIKEQRYPTRHELDSVCAERPVYLPRIYHAAAANSKALKLAGITRNTPQPAGGKIVHGSDGEPTGELHELPAFGRIEALIPSPSFTERKAAFLQTQQNYLAMGICGVIDPALTADEMAFYQQLADENELALRVVMMPLAPTTLPRAELEAWLENLNVRTGFGNALLKIGAMKIFLDGGASLGTALLREPYPDTRCYCGLQVTDSETFALIAHYCAASRWSLGVHTVGGAAIDLALDTFAAANDAHPIEALRFSLIHAYLWPSKENIALCRSLGVAVATQASMQYQFASGLVRRFGSAPIARATPIRSWLDGGVLVAGGSDAPATPANPFLGIWHATTRYVDALQTALGLEQAVGRQEALEMYTRHAAWLSFSEHERGMIRAGLRADWIELSSDPVTCGQDELKEIKVTKTVIDGTLQYEEA